MAGSWFSYSARAARELRFISTRKLRYMTQGIRARGMSQAESDQVGREAYAAAMLLEARAEDRLERIASEQLSGLVRSDFASMDHDGMAETAVSLAKALIARLDREEPSK